jgi:hypothetical protein
MTETRIGGGRKTAYYVGMLMMVAGFVTVFASFLPAFSIFGAATDFAGSAVSGASRGAGPDARAVTGFMGQVQHQVARTFGLTIGGTALIVVGALVRRAGSHGLAGAGVVLDPKRAREDVRPWSEMQGGVLRDTLDAAGFRSRAAAPPPPPAGTADMPFDEKLRRLHRLRQEGLLSEEEYQRERKQILDTT